MASRNERKQEQAEEPPKPAPLHVSQTAPLFGHDYTEEEEALINKCFKKFRAEYKQTKVSQQAIAEVKEILEGHQTEAKELEAQVAALVASNKSFTASLDGFASGLDSFQVAAAAVPNEGLEDHSAAMQAATQDAASKLKQLMLNKQGLLNNLLVRNQLMESIYRKMIPASDDQV